MSEFKNYLSQKSDLERQAIEKKQAECTHGIWSTWCAVCKKVLASDHHINYHTSKSFKTDTRVAILIGRPDFILTTKEIEIFNNILDEFDEITVITNDLSHLQVYEALKCIKKVTSYTLEQEIKHIKQYRYLDVKETQVFMYEDYKKAKDIDFCKRKKIQVNTLC